MAVTTMRPSPETPRAAEPVLGRALRPGIVLLNAPGGACEPWADKRALALLGCRDHAELAARWPAIRQHLLAAGLPLAEPSGSQGAASAAGTGATSGTSASNPSAEASAIAATEVELPPDLTGGRHLEVAMVAMDPRGAATPAALLLQDAELAAALESDLRAASQMRSLAQITPAVAHDLRAPINAMVLNLEVLKETLAAPPSTIPGNPAYPAPPPHPGQPLRSGGPGGPGRDPRERQQRYVSVLREELSRLHQSLELFLAHVSPRGERLETLDLRGPAQDLAALLRPPAHKQQTRIELLLPDAPVPVLAQRYQLRQALLHLGLAALEPLPRDGALEIRLERLPGRARARLRIAASAQPGAATSAPPSTSAAPATAAAPATSAVAPATSAQAPAPAAPPTAAELRFSAAGTEARQQVAHGIVASFGGTSRPADPDASAAAFEIEFPLAESN